MDLDRLKKHERSEENMKSHMWFIVLLMTISMFATAGCADMHSFGKFVPDDDAKIAFEKFQVNPDYRYYITGSDLYPVAILALNKSYSMGNDLWKELWLTPDSLNEIVINMQIRLLGCCLQNPFGFSVLDRQGKQIGMLYSYLGVGIVFKVDDNNVVKMYGPRDDDLLKKYQERTIN
jgi:hypothetical protein